eukprot:1141695-Pelagomonas_calceolata.AAC.4
MVWGVPGTLLRGGSSRNEGFEGADCKAWGASGSQCMKSGSTTAVGSGRYCRFSCDSYMRGTSKVEKQNATARQRGCNFGANHAQESSAAHKVSLSLLLLSSAAKQA